MNAEQKIQARVDRQIDELVNAHRIEEAIKHADRIRLIAHYRYLEAMEKFHRMHTDV